MSRAILVTGATGKQGGSVINALLARNAPFKILAVTRDASSPSAKRLAAKSSAISVVQGNLDDTESLFRNAKKATELPIWGVFSVQAPPLKKGGAAIEEVQGKSLVNSAIKHGAKHFVYSSVDRHGARSLENPTKVPHFASKHQIEHHLIDKAKGTDMSWTILRPVAFMENFVPGFAGKGFATAWREAIKSRPLQLVATDDIGVFAANSLLEPQRYASQSISLAGDELTFKQLEEVFRAKTGAPLPTTFGFLARILLWLSEEMGTMFAFFENEGYAADIPELRKTLPELKDLGAWLETSAYVKKAN
ncbi:nucleoside-diphosphate-sugar epimerase family protein [Dactylonectria estremocensis]|uniref:Nucleoside-diphosphate-sugar epimerase family protein n=1 Tax=Dactylonectria estremocensis TaxID=1079267 RepID=A0A9P9J117_9HYPO|nr:nucleoside-diphosphate-sugar epimerase family protein [Dactylonectria estremocensis]